MRMTKIVTFRIMITNRALYEHLREQNISFTNREEANKCIFKFCMNFLEINQDEPSETEDILLEKIRTFNSHLTTRWKKSKSVQKHFPKVILYGRIQLPILHASADHSGSCTARRVLKSLKVK